MRKPIWLWPNVVVLVVVLLLGSVGTIVWAQEGWRSLTQSPTLITSPVSGPFDSKTTFTVVGSGFEPGQEITLLLQDAAKNWSDVTSSMQPYPLKANEFGAFAATWLLDRWAEPAVGAMGLLTLKAVDADFNTLATAPLGLCPKAGTPAAEKAPVWCSAALQGQ